MLNHTTQEIDRVEESLKDRISQQKFKPGDKLPSLRKLSTDLNTKIHIVREAFQRLIRAGLIVPQIGHGHVFAGGPIVAHSRIGFFCAGRDVSMEWRDGSGPDMYGELELGIREKVAPENADVMLISPPKQNESWNSWTRNLRKMGLTGIVAFGLENPDAQQELVHSRIPSALIGNQYCHSSLIHLSYSNFEVGTGMAAIARMLAYKRILVVVQQELAFLFKNVADYESKDFQLRDRSLVARCQRVRGILSTLLTESSFLQGKDKCFVEVVGHRDAEEQIQRHLTDKRNSTPLLILNTHHQGTRLLANLSKNGIRIPQQISFLDHRWLQSSGFMMSIIDLLRSGPAELQKLASYADKKSSPTGPASIGWCVRELGRVAVQLVLETARNEEFKGTTVIVSPRFQAGPTLKFRKSN